MSRYNADMENLNIAKVAETVVNWAMKLCVGLLTVWSIDILDKINTSTAAMVQMGAEVKIMQHDIQAVEKRVERIETKIEALK